MFRPDRPQGIESTPRPIEKPYEIPDITDIASWELSKLEIELKKEEDEREKLLALMEKAGGIPNARIIGTIKELAFAGRAMFFELEKRNKK